MKGFCLKVTINKKVMILPNFYSEKYTTQQREHIRENRKIQLLNDPRNKEKTIVVSWVKAEKKEKKVIILEK